jgi:hypothetical protein
MRQERMILAGLVLGLLLLGGFSAARLVAHPALPIGRLSARTLAAAGNTVKAFYEALNHRRADANVSVLTCTQARKDSSGLGAYATEYLLGTTIKSGGHAYTVVEDFRRSVVVACDTTQDIELASSAIPHYVDARTQWSRYDTKEGSVVATRGVVPHYGDYETGAIIFDPRTVKFYRLHQVHVSSSFPDESGTLDGQSLSEGSYVNYPVGSIPNDLEKALLDSQQAEVVRGRLCGQTCDGGNQGPAYSPAVQAEIDESHHQLMLTLQSLGLPATAAYAEVRSFLIAHGWRFRESSVTECGSVGCLPSFTRGSHTLTFALGGVDENQITGAQEFVEGAP